MKKKSLACTLLLIAILTGCVAFPTRDSISPSPSPTAAPNADPTFSGEPLYIVTAQEFLSLRIRPDPSADRVKKLSPGAVVEIISIDGEFAAVTELATGYSGYVLINYLTALPDGYALPLPASQNEPGVYRVAADEFLSLRAEPSTDAERLRTIEAGSFVEAFSFSGNFAYVRYGDMEGYVLATYLEPAARESAASPVSPTPVEPEGIIGVISAENYASLRVRPDTGTERILKLPNGDRVIILDEMGEFTYVEATATGERGYVLNRLILSEDEYSRLPRADAKDTRYVDAMEYLTLRASPSMGADSLGTLSRGTTVTVLGRKGDFAYVEDDMGKRGYVLDGYLSQSKPKDQLFGTFTVVAKEYISLRAKPDATSERIDTIAAGESVELIGLDGLFARVRYDGTEGYVLSGYLKGKDETAYASLKIVKPATKYAPHQVGEDLAALSARYPDQLRVISAGKSSEGRDIPAALLGNPSAEHHVLVQAAIHGREHMTTLLAVAQIEDMLSRQDATYQGQSYRDLLNSVCFHILPMTNPDGVAISQSAKATSALEAVYSADRTAGLTDLSISDYLTEWKANARGVDLNRNFDAGWRGLSGPSSPSSNRYKGAKAEDQPETKALVDYTKKYDFDATVSYHSYGSLIYWEYGNDRAVLEASRSLARAVRAVTRYPLAGSGGLDAGGYKDWAMEMRSIPSITIETGTRACPLPLDEFDMIWRRNRDVLPALAVWALEN